MIQSDSGRPLMDGLFPVHRVPKVHNKSAIHRHSLPVDGAFLVWCDKDMRSQEYPRQEYPAGFPSGLDRMKRHFD